jgi:hypothetical protein
LVVEAVRPHRCDGHGEAWRLLAARHDEIKSWVDADLTGVKIHELLERRGVVVPVRTVQRYVLERCGRSRGIGPTVRIADGEPGDELQVDCGRMGFIVDVESGRRRVVQALIFTACYSRHCFVWLTYRVSNTASGASSRWIANPSARADEPSSPSNRIPSSRARSTPAIHTVDLPIPASPLRDANLGAEDHELVTVRAQIVG